MERPFSTAPSVIGMVVTLAVVGGWSLAFDQYSFVRNDDFPPPAGPAYNGCRTCHGDFNAISIEMSGVFWPQSLMDTHVEAMVGDNDCATCHSSGPRWPVLLNSSQGGNGLEPISCAGCHGRAEDGTPDPGDGARGYGLGLRRQHWNANVTIDLDPDPGSEFLINTRICADCHADADPASGATPVGEDVKPPYYADPEGGGSTVLHIPMPSDPCADPSNADTPEEERVGDALALDNDGDLVYDVADPDCFKVASSPGETSGPTLTALRASDHDPIAQTLSLSYGPPCNATDNTIVFGPLDQVSTYGYSGEVCGIMNSGSYVWNYAGAPESLFFLVVANDGIAEGSYGTHADTTERPFYGGNVVCPLPQDLANRCD